MLKILRQLAAEICIFVICFKISSMIPGFNKEISSLDSIVSFCRANRLSVLRISPLYGSSRSIVLSRLASKEKSILVLLPSEQQVMEAATEMRLMNPDIPVMEITSLAPEQLLEKITKIQQLPHVVIYALFSIATAPISQLQLDSENLLRISIDDNPGYEGMIEYFNVFNYTKQKFVEQKGEFARRGAIIDYWSYSESSPVRLEFDGDFLESIRYFDPDNQRSVNHADLVTLAPEPEEPEPGSTQIFTQYLQEPLILFRAEELRYIYQKNLSGAEKKITASVVFDEETDLPVETVTSLSADDEILPAAIPSPEELFGSLSATLLIEEPLHGTRQEAHLKPAPPVHGNYKTLLRIVKEYISAGNTVVVASENDIQTSRIRDILGELDDSLEDAMLGGLLRIVTFPVKEGFLAEQDKLLLLTDYQIFNKPYRTKVSTKQTKRKTKSRDLSSLVHGDFVVHEDYGIAKYTGLETIKIGESEFEAIKLIYNNGGTVYVNLNYLNKVKKYSAAEGQVPQLSTLGGTDWVNAKKKAKKRIKEAARELILLYARRKASPGFAFSPDSVWQNELEASFIYEDTPDQATVTEEVKKDMESSSPMDRLVCGDVGFGKTEIAVRAAFKAVQEAKQVAVLVPTTILAEQHYNTFRDRLTQFPVRVEQLSRFMTKKENTEVANALKEGTVDIVIGTHRLLSKDIGFKDLGLLIIDEEHRFGVMAKDKLKSMKANLDTLTLTATPIPRTLNLSLLGARDLSLITTPPPNRQPVYTKIEIFNIGRIREWINHELDRGGQVYIVHDRVKSIDNFAAYLTRHMPGLSVGIAHGQLKPAALEDVIHKFLNKEFKVLLSTKIIESGIDIPSVNTIIINRADRFGLAELHQLRGRVGRSDKQAYAYFLVPSLDAINAKSLKRLQAIEEYAELGAGFNLAMRDMEIRGAGNLLGTEQSGTINEVGFDLYLKLINEAVEELKAEEFKEVFKDLPKEEKRTDPAVETWFEIGIPNHYMPDQNERLYFYTGLFSVTDENELEDYRREIIDRFGKTPPTVNRLFAAALLKLAASRALFERINIQRKTIFISLPSGKNEFYEGKFAVLMQLILRSYKETIQFRQEKDSLKLIVENRFETPEKSITFLMRFCIAAAAEFGSKSEKQPIPEDLAS